MAKDEGDHCTLSPASVVDAVDLSRDGVLNLYAVEESNVCVRVKCPKIPSFTCSFLFQSTPWLHVSWFPGSCISASPSQVSGV